jgi:four helix bundle protein
MNKPHKKLDAWAIAVDLAHQIYKTTDGFPVKEQFGLISQARRAAVSVPSNIAEGVARRTKREFLQFLHIAKGSLSELDTQLEIARRLKYLEQKEWETLDAQLERVDRMLSGLIRHAGAKS